MRQRTEKGKCRILEPDPECAAGATDAQRPKEASQMNARVVKSDAEWRAQLTPLQYNVTRKKGTERSFSGEYLDCPEMGVFHCVCCGAPLFDSASKFDSGSGWPSFQAPIDRQNIRTQEDCSWLIRRTEVLCAACDAHLGHVLDDGASSAGTRYCINSAALRLEKER